MYIHSLPTLLPCTHTLWICLNSRSHSPPQCYICISLVYIPILLYCVIIGGKRERAPYLDWAIPTYSHVNGCRCQYNIKFGTSLSKLHLVKSMAALSICDWIFENPTFSIVTLSMHISHIFLNMVDIQLVRQIEINI